MMIGKRCLKFLGLLVILGVLAACSAGGAKVSDQESIRIGALYPLSGDLALLGQESFRGVELAVEERNQNGGVAGKHLEIVKADAPTPDDGQAEANRLITRENVSFIVGSYSSGISFASSEVAERNGKLYWELGAVSNQITDRGYKYILRVNPPASYFSRVHIDFIEKEVARHLGKDPTELKIAIVHEDSSYGTTIAEEAVRLAKKNGLNVVSVQPYASSSNDLSSVILNLKNAQPDIVIAVSYLNDAVLLAKQSKELGFDVPVFIGSGGGHTMVDFAKSVGELAEGVFNVDFPQYEINKEFTPGIERFLKLYKEKYKSEPTSGHSLANYMGMHVVLDIIESANGNVDADTLREAAMNYTLESGQSATGWGVKFDPKTGQNTEAQPYVHQWIEGKMKVVWPEDVAVTKPVFNN